MFNFRVKLEPIQFLFPVSRRSDFCVFRGTRDVETGGQFSDGIAMAHPATRFCIQTFEKAVSAFYFKLGEAVFSFFSALDGSTHGVNHKLHAIADAKHGNAKVKNSLVHLRAVFFIYT